MKPKLKSLFKSTAMETDTPRMLSVAVQLPSGAIETIVNYHNIEDKIQYYLSAYNDDFELKANTEVKIVACMLV